MKFPSHYCLFATIYLVFFCPGNGSAQNSSLEPVSPYRGAVRIANPAAWERLQAPTPPANPVVRPEARTAQPPVLPPRRPTYPVSRSRPHLYFLEFGSYASIVKAKLYSLQLNAKGAPTQVVQDVNGNHHVISDGYFETLDDASRARDVVKQNIGSVSEIMRKP